MGFSNELSLDDCEASSLLYFLCFQDTLERLDTMMLEIRHLQVSIISHLREPIFYRLLRYEESFLWGGGDNFNWRELFDEIKDVSPESFASNHIHQFPVARKGSRPNHECGAIQDLMTNIFNCVFIHWYEKGWSTAQKQNYHVLRVTQKLKRQIFSDKLYLVKYAQKYGILDFKESTHRAKFTILRSAIHRRMGKFISRIRDTKYIFNEFIDSGRQDSPRPSIMRRREAGIYKNFLSDRSKDMREEMSDFLEFLKVEKTFSHGPILHRWRHDNTSKCTSFRDDVRKYRYINRKVKSDESGTEFINSSYFMPERPDLLPVLAHEIAHSTIRSRFDDFSYLGLLAANDDFTELLLEIRHATELSAKTTNIEISGSMRSYFYKELSCDFLAASLEGLSFLYALFIETLGHSLADALEAHQGHIDLSMIEHFENTKPTHHQTQLFLTRIQLNCVWIRCIQHKPFSKLDMKLISGIEKTCFELSCLLKTTAHPLIAPQLNYWPRLTKRLEEIIESSSVVNRVKVWRRQKSKDTRSKGTNIDLTSNWSRTVFPLDSNIRALLFELQVKIKKDREQDRGGYEQLTGVTQEDMITRWKTEFSRFYGFGEPKKDLPEDLYPHLRDIPWQCSLTRVIDFCIARKPPNKTSLSSLLHDVHFDMALGRELFAIGLEFYLWQTEPPNIRLITVINLVSSLIEDEKYSKSLKALLKKWLGEDCFSGQGTNHDRQDKLVDDLLAKLKHSSINNLKHIAEQFPARIISRSFSVLEIESDRKVYRVAEQVSGKKLDELLEMLCDKDKPKDYFPRELTPLTKYLGIREQSDKQEFHKLIPLALFSKDDDDSLPKIENYMIGRHAFTGTLPRVDSEDFYLPIRDMKAQNQNIEARQIQSRHGGVISEQTLIPVLGRYDMLSIYETRPLCRCNLSIFDNEKYDKAFSTTDDSIETSLGKLITTERFPLYSARREHAFKVSLSKKNRTFPKKYLGFIVLTLQRKSFRLSLLYRLFNSSDQKTRDEIDEVSCLDDLNGWLDEDFAFLMDGWGDIMLVFTDQGLSTHEAKLESIKKIFKIQDILFEDFMIDYTETFFTPGVLDIIWGSEEFDIRVETRLIEDRLLSRANKDYIKGVNERMNKLDSVPASDKWFTASKTTGRMDYLFSINPDNCHKSNNTDLKIFGIVNDIFNEPQVDAIETKLSRIENMKFNGSEKVDKNT